MQTLGVTIPSSHTLLALSPRELAAHILEFIRKNPRIDGSCNRQDVKFASPMGDDVQEVADAISSAWHWLCNEGILMPGRDIGWWYLSPTGKRILAENAYFKTGLPEKIPAYLLNPLVVTDAEAEHLRGANDLAVFAAFRRLEIVVLAKTGLPQTTRGDALMRAAFNPASGALRDLSLPEAERLNEANLFAGAFGCYRNATGHRDVNLDAKETAQILVLVSMLIDIVESRAIVTL